MAAQASLFDPALISRPVALPSDHNIRPLRVDDYANGFDTILMPLAPTQEALSVDTFSEKFEQLISAIPQCYYIVVITLNDKIIGSATLLTELKFLRNGRTAGHIEDVVVSPDHQGKQLGKILIDCLTSLAKRLGCYKVVLDCADKNVGFYEKCGYERAGIEMKKYL